MYLVDVRRIQLYVEQDLDIALSAEAARLGVSRSAVMRDAVRVALAPHFEHLPDPVDALIGTVDVEPDEDLDSVIYGFDE